MLRYEIKVERYVEVWAKSYEDALALYVSGKANVDRLVNIELFAAFPLVGEGEYLGF